MSDPEIPSDPWAAIVEQVLRSLVPSAPPSSADLETLLGLALQDGRDTPDVTAQRVKDVALIQLTTAIAAQRLATRDASPGDLARLADALCLLAMIQDDLINDRRASHSAEHWRAFSARAEREGW